jgi:hypothetical protein
MPSKIIYTPSFPIIEPRFLYITLNNIRNSTLYYRRMFDHLSGDLTYFYAITDTDRCCIQMCNLPWSTEIKITCCCNNVKTFMRHNFDPTDFSSNVNKYLLTEEELENQKIVRDSCECAGFT